MLSNDRSYARVFAVYILTVFLGEFITGGVALASTSALCKLQCGGNRCADAGQAQQCVDVVCKDLNDKESRSILKKCQGALSSAQQAASISGTNQEAAHNSPLPTSPVYVGSAAAPNPCGDEPGASLPPGYRKIQGAVLDLTQQGVFGGRVFVFDTHAYPEIAAFGTQIRRTPYHWIRWKDRHPKVRGRRHDAFDIVSGNVDKVEAIIKDNDGGCAAEVVCMQPGRDAPSIAVQVLAAADPLTLPPLPPAYDPCHAGPLTQGEVFAEGAIVDLPGVAPARKVFFFDPGARENMVLAGLGKPFGNSPLRYIELDMPISNKPEGGLKTQYKISGAGANPVRVVVKTASGVGHEKVACVVKTAPTAIAAIPPIIEPCDGNAILHPHYEVVIGGLITDDTLASGQNFYFEALSGHPHEGLGVPTGRSTPRGEIRRIAWGRYPLLKTVDGLPADYSAQQDFNHVEVVVNTAVRRGGSIGEVVCVNTAVPSHGKPLVIPPADATAEESDDPDEAEEDNKIDEEAGSGKRS